MSDVKRQEAKRVSARRSDRRKGRTWTREMVGELTSADIARLSPADAAALLTMGKEGVVGCSDLARAGQRVDAYNRMVADLLRRIDVLPRGHPEREAACARIRAVRPKALKAMDELRYLQIKYALQLDDTPTNRMSRA